MKKKLPKSLCKYIRFEKARIRRDSLSSKEHERLIDELYKSLVKQKNEELFIKKSEKREIGLPDA
ncbi:MAG: hypothetical protein ISS83_01290 [Candidatus Pacebacteria bacterium]|nr:hypothetical protein [Candidatus Paceibacterota bacterium]